MRAEVLVQYIYMHFMVVPFFAVVRNSLCRSLLKFTHCFTGLYPTHFKSSVGFKNFCALLRFVILIKIVFNVFSILLRFRFFIECASIIKWISRIRSLFDYAWILNVSLENFKLCNAQKSFENIPLKFTLKYLKKKY